MRFVMSVAAWAILSTASVAAPLGGELEEAAVIGVGMMVCDTNHGVGSSGWNDLIMRGSQRKMISQAAAQEFVEARQREIITHLNKTGRLDEFCRNIRAGRIR